MTFWTGIPIPAGHASVMGGLGRIALAVALALFAYLLLWPVPIDPVRWDAPPDPGYTGPFATNDRLAALETLSIGANVGPEDVALDSRGRIYAATHDGRIVRLDADGTNPVDWVDTGGRPLGIEFDARGHLLVADAFRGLLSVAPDGAVTVLASDADGIAIRYADDLDVTADGRVFFSDASAKFGALDARGTYEASLLDLMEHGGHGRLLVYDPATGKATTVLDGLQFANGVAVSPDQSYVLVNETGAYRVMRYWLAGPRAGEAEPFIEALPGFPDNLSAGRDGRFWIGLASPRNALLDKLSDRPWLRRVVQRLPAFMRPKATHYGHVIAVDEAGQVVVDLQDPEGRYPLTTGAIEADGYLYVSSLIAPVLARLPDEAWR